MRRGRPRRSMSAGQDRHPVVGRRYAGNSRIEQPRVAYSVLAFLLVIGPLIFVHELGHYFVGRWFGVKAETFSIGFGRELFGWTDKRGTRWKVGWLPLGGYVRFKGDMNPASTPSDEWLSLPAEERAETFQAKKLWQRFLIVLAGPLTNFLFAILVYVALFASYGQPRTPAISRRHRRRQRRRAGRLPTGDRIVRIDGREIGRFEDMISYIAIRPGQPMRFDVERGGQRLRSRPRPDEVQRDHSATKPGSAASDCVPAGSRSPGCLRIRWSGRRSARPARRCK